MQVNKEYERLCFCNIYLKLKIFCFYSCFFKKIYLQGSLRENMQAAHMRALASAGSPPRWLQ